MDLKLNYKGKSIRVKDVKICDTVLSKFKGLMFANKDNAQVLVFKFKKPTNQAIHSLFVRFPFISIWLDEHGKVVEIRIIKPWKLYVKSKQKFSKLIEVPINKKYQEITKIIVGDRNI